MSNVIIIHGCPSDIEKAMDPDKRTYDKHWIPWLKKILTEKGVKVETPLMPDPWYPNYDSFREKFETCDITEETTLIGHSCGCAFLVRWLGDSKQKISKLILVAPWKIPDEDNDIKKQFYNYEIDEDIRSNVGEVIIFTSDDEEEDGKKSARIFNDSIGGKIIELKQMGHYTKRDMGKEDFPELLELI